MHYRWKLYSILQVGHALNLTWLHLYGQESISLLCLIRVPLSPGRAPPCVEDGRLPDVPWGLHLEAAPPEPLPPWRRGGGRGGTVSLSGGGAEKGPAEDRVSVAVHTGAEREVLGQTEDEKFSQECYGKTDW